MADSNVDITSGEYMLTTMDNPYDPFTQFDEWYVWDVSHGYHSAAFLARVAQTSEDLSEADQRSAIQAAIHQICQENVSGIHRKVLRSS
jgi:hypothetical protein